MYIYLYIYMYLAAPTKTDNVYHSIITSSTKRLSGAL